MEQSWPFSGTEALEDRWGQMARHWLRRSGVIPDGPLGALRVAHDAVNGGMRVIGGPGEGSVEGYYYVNDAPLTLPIAAAQANPRIDAVVLRLDKTIAPPHRITAAVLSGAAAASPGLPALTTNATIWEVPLAYVRVNPGAGGIQFKDVRDARVFTRDPLHPRNYLYNPGFEVNQRPEGGMATFDMWIANVVNGTVALAPIGSTIGAHGQSAQLTYTHNASLGGFADLRQVFNAITGREYIQWRDRTLTFAVDVKSSVPQTVQLWISSGGTAPTTFSAFNVSTGEERLFVTHHCDIGTTQVQIVVRVGNQSAVVELNNATLCLGPVPLAYAPLNEVEERARCQRFYELHQNIIVEANAPAGGVNWTQRVGFNTLKAGEPTLVKIGTWLTANCAQPNVRGASPQGYAIGAVPNAAGQFYFLPDTADDVIVAGINPW